MNELGNQFGSAIIVSYLLEYLKGKDWFPLISYLSSSRAKAIVGGLAAFITTLGISYAFDYHPSGNSTLTIVIPAIPQLIHSLLDFAKQWAMQQFVYDTAVKNSSSPKLMAASKTMASGAILSDVSGNPIHERN